MINLRASNQTALPTDKTKLCLVAFLLNIALRSDLNILDTVSRGTIRISKKTNKKKEITLAPFSSVDEEVLCTLL